MRRHTRPTYPMLSPADDSGDGASGVEDSLRGTAAFGRGGPVANNLSGRPAQVGTSSNVFAFAVTPDSALPPSTSPPPHAVWHSPRGPVRAGHHAAAAASSIDETPEAGPSTHFHLGPPRIERQAPAARAQPHTSAPPLPVFAAPAMGPGAGSGHNLFARPPPTASTASTGVNAFGSPTMISMSGSFSFAPRGAAGALFALPAARIHVPAAEPAAAQPQFAAPHTPIRSARPTTATTNVTTSAIAAANLHHPMPTSPSTTASAPPTNLDAAALAAEQRIRQARASREDALTRRSVSFTPIVSTPDANAGAYNAVGVAPPPPYRATGGVPARAAESSLSHLGRVPRFAPPPGADSFSIDSTFARPTATRLFAPTSAPTADAHTASLASTASEPSASWSAETASVAAPPTVRLRKWDGSQALVPAYLLSDSAEQALEEQLFDHAIAHFDPAAIVKRHAAAMSGTATAKEPEEADAVQSILDIQLGLSGLHGWYGHTFQAEGSRKRRRSSSRGSNDPILVYDAFGRVRGTITLPNYKARGGPPLPLPSPRETHALRTTAAAAHVLATTSHLVAKEDALTQRESFQAKHRPALLKGLQNAYLDAAAHAPRRIEQI